MNQHPPLLPKRFLGEMLAQGDLVVAEVARPTGLAGQRRHLAVGRHAPGLLEADLVQAGRPPVEVVEAGGDTAAALVLPSTHVAHTRQSMTTREESPSKGRFMVLPASPAKGEGDRGPGVGPRLLALSKGGAGDGSHHHNLEVAAMMFSFPRTQGSYSRSRLQGKQRLLEAKEILNDFTKDIAKYVYVDTC